MQMLGQELEDPQGLEGGGPSSETGLGLLPLHTIFTDNKALRQRSSAALWPEGNSPLQLEGFELHYGRTTASAPCEPVVRWGSRAGLGQTLRRGWWPGGRHLFAWSV